MTKDRIEKNKAVSHMLLECLEKNEVDDLSAVTGLASTLLVLHAINKKPLIEFEKFLELLRNSYEKTCEVLDEVTKLEKKNP